MQQLSFFNPPPRPVLRPLVGYGLTADNCLSKDREFTTYMMARSLEDAFGWCLKYFPLEEGYIRLEVWNYDTDIKRMLMPDEYIERDGKITPIQNGIINLAMNPTRLGELEFHIPDCEIYLQDCPECWEYYSNMGHDAYVVVLTSKMK